MAILPIESAEEIAVVLFVTGDAFYVQNGKKSEVKKNTILKKQDQIETINGKVDLQIGSNSVIRISPYTKIQISELSSSAKENKSTIDLISGKVFAKVDKNSKKENFVITSASYTAGVRGTQFVIGEESEQKRASNPDHEDSNIPNGIFVKEGEVGVSTDSNNTTSVRSDEEIVFSPTGLLKQPLQDFMKEKMKIMDEFRRMKEENYKILRDQIFKNQELLHNANTKANQE
ncbi:sigma factor regulatory protein, FecR/PupR family [Leptospira fainei serovar Hurstbridge str. BUT 6]|uniref:Sigma factor regulatory protein, FecR/PupR family n=2 Tax=Leptospira fainei TaxID=48782 RepID=S3UTU7_9LEPT|nr:FecR family protein [Leptospira fainei]EPG72678.1 sigma factor regulatory protein, FecR/PupR family [Leptospira fainei serovar Hurstbridge str. BUT 6]